MFELRDYQREAVDYAINADGRPILCAPTGSGKTVVAAFVAQHYLERGERVAFLTPREEILWQNHGVVQDVCGEENVTVLKAGEEWRQWLPMHIVSWPTLVARTGRKQGGEAWYPDVDVLLIDECHLAVSKRMAERVLPYYADRKVIGVTATPARSSGRGLGSYFTEIKHVTTVRQLVKDEFLAPCEYWGGKEADLRKVRTVAGDFNRKQLSERVAPLVGDVVENWCRLAEDRHTLVFAVDVAHAEALAERFQAAGIVAESLHIHKTPEHRRRIVEQFKSGHIQVLVNVTIASYGFDAPSVDCVVLARPTKSIVLHLQMLGRGMRIDPERPDKVCRIIDHAGNVTRLGAGDDLYRWRLDDTKRAAGNWSRDKRSGEKETKQHTCEDCNYIFSRSLVCPKCGWAVPLPKRDIDAVDAELVRIARNGGERPHGFPDDATFHRMLHGWSLKRGYAPGWIYHTFRDYAGKPPPWGYDRLGPLEPSPLVRNWLTKRAKAYRRRQRA